MPFVICEYISKSVGKNMEKKCPAYKKRLTISRKALNFLGVPKGIFLQVIVD